MPGSALSRLVSLMVPPLCAVCREPEPAGRALCRKCSRHLVAIDSHRCRRCGAPSAHDARSCRECRGRDLAFSHAWSAFAYEGIARDVVGAFKSRGVLVLAALMAGEIVARAPEGVLAGTLVPVPAHAGRLRKHGFNQAHLLAGAIGRKASLPERDVLRRRPAAAQVGLERHARLENARGAVCLRAGAAAPRRAVVVDDVYTTGATLDSCAQALIEAGAQEVVAVTFARAVRERISY